MFVRHRGAWAWRRRGLVKRITTAIRDDEATIGVELRIERSVGSIRGWCTQLSFWRWASPMQHGCTASERLRRYAPHSRVSIVVPAQPPEAQVVSTDTRRCSDVNPSRVQSAERPCSRRGGRHGIGRSNLDNNTTHSQRQRAEAELTCCTSLPKDRGTPCCA